MLHAINFSQKIKNKTNSDKKYTIGIVTSQNKNISLMYRILNLLI